jgi:hypothetical protein
MAEKYSRVAPATAEFNRRRRDVGKLHAHRGLMVIENQAQPAAPVALEIQWQ